MNPDGGMENGSHSKAYKLFKQILQGEELKGYTEIQAAELTKICKEIGVLFHRKVKKKPNQIMAFLTNYHHVIVGCKDKHASEILNNISLHFILLSSYSMIENGDKDAAKELLKKSISYIASTGPDPILLVTAINNLCVLRMEKGKYYKSLPLLLQNLQIIQIHMRSLKLEKKKDRIIEDSVFLINTYLLLTKCLKKVSEKNSKMFYRELFNYCSHNGLKKSMKYLGSESIFTKKFKSLIDDFDFTLPIFVEEETEKSEYEEKIIKRLENIEKLLLTAPKEVIVIKEEKKEEYIPPPPPPVLEDKNLVCRFNFMVNNWKVEIQILKQADQKVGTIVINCQKGREVINLIIVEEKMLKLLSQMNIEDVIPYECSLYNLTSEEFVRFCLMNFLFISDNKNIEIYPRSIGFMPPFETNILKKQFIVFTNHIRFNTFRLAICPKKECVTSYLEVELTQKFMSEVATVQEQTEERIEKVYCMLMEAKKKSQKMEVNEFKSVKILNQNKFVEAIKEIIEQFKVFLADHMTETATTDVFEKENQFFKYVQLSTGGRFYYIRYLPHLKGFDIYLANTAESYKLNGMAKARGYIFYNSFQFFRDFGISYELCPNKFKCFCEILCRKYGLQTYENPLGTKDAEIYKQNSISDVKINSKTFFRKMRAHKNFVMPLTACIVNVNNEVPIGIKLSGYDPINCCEMGYFIHIYHLYWKWPKDLKEVNPDFLNNVVEQYPYRKDYFLVEWLERYGFRRIVDLLRIDEKDVFHIEGLKENVFRIANLIDLII